MSDSRRADPELSVVIPTLGRRLVRRVLESLASGDVRPAAVIVVDQGRDPAIERLAAGWRGTDLEVVYIPSSQTGRSAALNTGIARVTTPYLAVTDDDCLPAPDWIARLGTALRAAPRTIVTGRVEAGAGEVVLAVATAAEPELQRRPRLRFDRLSGGNMALATALARELGPFAEDPCMRTAEDAEFAYRALRAGVAIAYRPDVLVHHLGWRNAAERAEQYRSYGFSQGGFYGAYLRRGDLFIALRALVHLLRSLRRWCRGLWRGDSELARNGRAYVLGFWPGLAAGLRSSRSPR
jgi:cellulose synthase/poly-beta-1,6-N-acetylglucosamine synthase-like glycosyltransferase